MPINEKIPLGYMPQSSDMSGMMQAAQLGNMARQRPMQDAMMQQQLQTGQQDIALKEEQIKAYGMKHKDELVSLAKKEYDLEQEKRKTAAKLYEYAQDQGTYDAVRPWASALGVDFGDMYDADKINGFVGGYKKADLEQKLSDQDKRQKEWEKIAAMPDSTDEEKKAKLAATTNYWAWAAQSQAYKHSEAGQQGAVELQQSLIPGSVTETAQKKSVEAQIDLSKKKEEAKIDQQITNDKNAGTVQETMDILDEIISDKNLATGLNPARLASVLPGTAQYTSAQRVQLLKNKLALAQRGQLKGQGTITDYEAKMLEKSISLLDTNLDKKTFDAELKKVRAILEKKLPKTDGSDFDSFWNEVNKQ